MTGKSMEDFKVIMIIMEGGWNIEFKGRYRRDLEKPNWHYYQDTYGNINHFKKSKMIAVIEGYNSNVVKKS